MKTHKKRDLSKAQFEAKAAKLGFTPGGFGMGYWNVGDGLHVSVFNAGKRRRDWLNYLIRSAKEHALRTKK